MKKDSVTQPIVSVIIPVYEVEPYLSRCIRSVMAQLYERLEIILVDDGSLDRSGIMCDDYADEDSRIIVVHQNNLGLSGARNTGINKCTGDYVMFVDSDDWIEPDMVKVMVDAAECNTADVCCCGSYNHSHREVKKKTSYEKELVIRRDDILTEHINGSISNTAWGKLWKRRVFEYNIRFPVGRNYEDIATTWRLLSLCDSAVYVPRALYHYEPRASSITRIHSLSNICDYWTAYKERFQILGQRDAWHQRTEISCLDAAGYVWKWYYSAAKAERQSLKNERNNICISGRLSDKELLEEVHQFALEHSNCIRRRDCPFNIKITIFLARYNNKTSLLTCHLLNQGYRLIARKIR